MTGRATRWAVAIASVAIVIAIVVRIDRERELHEITHDVHHPRELQRHEHDEESRQHDETTVKGSRSFADGLPPSPMTHPERLARAEVDLCASQRDGAETL